MLLNVDLSFRNYSQVRNLKPEPGIHKRLVVVSNPIPTTNLCSFLGNSDF